MYNFPLTEQEGASIGIDSGDENPSQSGIRIGGIERDAEYLSEIDHEYHSNIVYNGSSEQKIDCMDHSGVYSNDSQVSNKLSIDPLVEMTSEYVTQLCMWREDWPEITPQNASEQLEVYNHVKTQRVYNLMGAKVPVNSTLRTDVWQSLSTGHVDDNWILQMVEYGFPLQYEGGSNPSSNIEYPNHASGSKFAHHVRQFIRKELASNTLLGPFDCLPFAWANVAPIMTRPKSDPGKRRVIVDYSFPEGGVNAYIGKNKVFGHDIIHRLPTVSAVLDKIKANDFRVLMASVDLERAYRNFRVDPLDWPLTCIKFDSKYYVDTAVPFGSRVSSLYMQKIAEFLRRAFCMSSDQHNNVSRRCSHSHK